MAINLATKYAEQIDSVFTHESFVAGKVNPSFSFTGVKAIKVYQPLTVAPVDYQRSGSARYGTPTELQDSVQELVISQDKSFSLTVDKGNNEEQMGIKEAGRMLQLELAEQVTPMADIYALSRFATEAGNIAAVSAALTETNILEAINEAAIAFDNALVPQENRYLFLGAKQVGMVRRANDWLRPDALAVEALTKGVAGEIYGFAVVKVPDNYLPAGVQFLAFHRDAVMMPEKMQDSKVHLDPPGISGALIEGRIVYDAFVLGRRANAVYTCALAEVQQAAPTITVSGNSVTLASAGCDSLHYTTDGSDPRYSDSAKLYSAALTVEKGKKLRAVAKKAGKLSSNLAEKTI